ncbi:unnamed protein product, partial [Rotaria sp. Silwood2]
KAASPSGNGNRASPENNVALNIEHRPDEDENEDVDEVDIVDEISEEKHQAQCDGCNIYPIASDRYKCLICDDFDLCVPCFERRIEPKQHKRGHPMVHFRFNNELFDRIVKSADITLEKLEKFYVDELHESTPCDGCEVDEIRGLRFKCDICPNYDLCQKCMHAGVTNKNHKSYHPLIVASDRSLAEIEYEDVELGEELGRGGFGCVYKAYWKPRELTVACKVITAHNSTLTNDSENSFFKEVAAYMELSGGYILKTYGIAHTEEGDIEKYMIIMEYMPLGSLAKFLKHNEGQISLRRKVKIAREIASGMRKIHEHNMIHRDIRPDNILITDNYTAKVADMGIARVLDPVLKHTQTGCICYMPPEFWKGTYDQKLDIFTFGLTLNELFTETQHTFNRNAAKKITLQTQSPIFRSLIDRCTADNPKDRPTASEIEYTLDVYARYFETEVIDQKIPYLDLSIKHRNNLFLQFYKVFQPRAKRRILERFPPTTTDDSSDTTTVIIKKNDNDSSDCVIL